MVAAPERLARMRAAARQKFLDNFTADRSYALTRTIYDRAAELAGP
jgi:hypothetical protein